MMPMRSLVPSPVRKNAGWRAIVGTTKHSARASHRSCTRRLDRALLQLEGAHYSHGLPTSAQAHNPERSEPALLPRAAGSLVLRRLWPHDLRAFQSYRNDPDVGRYQGWQAMSDAQALDFLNDVATQLLLQPGHWTQIAVADAETNALYGDIGLHVAADGAQAEIGFTLAPQAQGRGLGTAAVRSALALLFEHTAVVRIIAVTDARNEPSLRLLERVGMARIATQPALFRGQPCVEHTYALDAPAR